MVHVRFALAPRHPRPDRRARVGTARDGRPPPRGRAAGPARPSAWRPRGQRRLRWGALSSSQQMGPAGQLPCPRDAPGAFCQRPCRVSVGNGRTGDSRVFHPWCRVRVCGDCRRDEPQKNRLGLAGGREMGTSCPLHPSERLPPGKLSQPGRAGSGFALFSGCEHLQ